MKINAEKNMTSREDAEASNMDVLDCDVAILQRNNATNPSQFINVRQITFHLSSAHSSISACYDCTRSYSYECLKVLLHNLSVSFVIAVGFFCCFRSVSSHPRLRSYAYGHMVQPKPICTTLPPEIDSAHQATRKWTSRRYAAVCLPRLNCLSIFPSYILLYPLICIVHCAQPNVSQSEQWKSTTIRSK